MTTGTNRTSWPRTGIEPTATAVVCVECQRGVIGDDSILPALNTVSGALVDGLRRLLPAARAAGATVVHATFHGTAGAHDPGSAPLWRAIAGPTADWSAGHPDTEILPELLSPADLIIARRHGLSPTWRTELLPVLRGRGVRTIVLAGVSVNVALLLAAGEAAQEGFGVVVPRDAVAGTPADYPAAVLRHSFGLLATVTTVADLTAHWQDTASPAIRKS
ncbi:cysteine hydrolase [Frankia gtarii]|uniref:cysteine hydrolase n=1 Tax=Frankia gtarii TaxID=2950102 RepID=UPI0021C17C21|nr:cysteine hydrolase [Frankia gtarii]